MRSAARAMGHAVHPMLVVSALGLISTVVVSNLHPWTDPEGFEAAAAYTMAAGNLGGTVATRAVHSRPSHRAHHRGGQTPKGVR